MTSEMCENNCKKYQVVDTRGLLRESSFNMTRGGDEDIEGGLRKFLDTRKGGCGKIRGGSENLYTLNPKGGGGGS